MKGLLIIAIAGIVAISWLAYSPSTSLNESQFREFIDTYRVGYGSSDEYNYRLGVFEANLKIIEEMRLLNPLATFGVNQFADKTQQEMQSLMGFSGKIDMQDKHESSLNTSARKNVDWSSLWKNPKDQGSCGSWWAFSAIGAIEGRYAIKKGLKTVETSLSEQQLVDCDKRSHACNGGLMTNAFYYLKMTGVCKDSEYPYKAKEEKCHGCTGFWSLSGYKEFNANLDDILTELVNGPISVAVDATKWQFYTGGVFQNWDKNLNHGVTLVGYNESPGYLKIRNSWGNWGENGYIRLSVGDTCGVTQAASYPTLF